MSEIHKNLLLIFGSFSILFIVNPNWFYIKIGGPDQWAALLYLNSFKDFLPDLMGSRTARFGWLIPGQFLIDIFGIEVGVVIFPVIFFLITLFIFFSFKTQD